MHGFVFIGLAGAAAADLVDDPSTPVVPLPAIITIGANLPPAQPPSEPPGTPTGDIEAAIEAYFAPADWAAARCIQRHEWGGPPGTDHNPGYLLPDGSRSEDSWGWWQINLLAHPYVTIEQCRDVDWSTRYAANLRYGRGDWGDWANSAIACGVY